MAGRPKKHTVDYFPHDTHASHGRTLTILQNKFGNNGVMVWWRLLEILGQSEGLTYNCSDSNNWEFLVAEMHVDDISVTEILDLLAKLGAIDQALWGQKIIWSQNFVDRLSQIFNKRRDDLPSRPVISVTEIPIKVTEIPPLKQSTLELDTNTLSPPSPIPLSPVTPQSKENKIKVKETKEKEVTTETEFLEFVEDTKSQYPDLDCEVEFRKFKLYWSESGKKLKRPKLAWTNWLEKARQFKADRIPSKVVNDRPVEGW